jgi:SAM-dependent methyltransferase
MRRDPARLIVAFMDTTLQPAATGEPAITPPGPSHLSAVWARAFAVVYDPFVWAGERAGLRGQRHALLDWSVGCTVEIGAGTGLNLPHYPDHLDALVLAEPDASMRSRLAARLARRRGHGPGARAAEVIDAPAERLPFPDGSVDTVVSTFVLCTVDAPHLAMQEIARVLKPGGQLLFIEHVRSDSPALAGWQDRLAHPWQVFARGCRCNRPTAELIVACGLDLEHVDSGAWRVMPPIVRPLVTGRARKPAADEASRFDMTERTIDASHR